MLTRTHSPRDRRLARLLLLGALLSGCGGDGKPGLDGNWAAAVDSACGYSFRVKSAERTYDWAFACRLEGGGVGADLESGDLDLVAPGKITFRPRRASCPSRKPDPATLTYELSDRSLSLVFPNAVIKFERSVEDDSSGVISLGCWSEDRLFTESPVKGL
jgi:hypothetical protein